MKYACITLSDRGASLQKQIALLYNADIYLHECVGDQYEGMRFSSVIKLTERIFHEYDALLYTAPCGVVVRAIGSLCQSKLVDPAVLVCDVGGRYVISLLCGHEGGANRLCMEVSNLLSAEPVITTTSEAVKNLIVGIGCRKGIDKEDIITAINTSLESIGKSLEDVRLLATADVKRHENGILDTSESLSIPLRIIPSSEIRKIKVSKASNFVHEKVGLDGVCEPSALLAGRRTVLRIGKKKFKGVTIAVAEENCLWSESDQVHLLTEQKEQNLP